jgi:hypothetical protein
VGCPGKSGWLDHLLQPALSSRRNQPSPLPDSAGGFRTCGCSLVKSAGNTMALATLKVAKKQATLLPAIFIYLKDRTQVPFWC